MTQESKEAASNEQSSGQVQEQGKQESHGPGAHSAHKSEGHGHAHSYSKSDVEHVKRSILIDKYSSMYDYHPHDPYFKTLLHKLMGHKHHSAIISTDISSPEYESMSESERVDRSLYALWKISKVNHHFFSPSEQDVIEPREYRIARKTFILGVSAAISSYLTLQFFTGRLTAKKGIYSLGAYAAVKAVCFGTEVFYENVKMPSRRTLAKQYMDIYGPKELFEISKPSYCLDKLSHMHNKKYM